jgi:hypothetical protein
VSERCCKVFSASFFEQSADRAETHFPALTEVEAVAVSVVMRVERAVHCDVSAEMREAMSVSCCVIGSEVVKDEGLNLTV